MDRIWLEVYGACQRYDTIEEYINDLMDKIEGKSSFSHSAAPLYYGNYFTGYYFVVFKSYMAFYRIEQDAMLIDRVLLGRSDYMSTLGFVL